MHYKAGCGSPERLPAYAFSQHAKVKVVHAPLRSAFPHLSRSDTDSETILVQNLTK